MFHVSETYFSETTSSSKSTSASFKTINQGHPTFSKAAATSSNTFQVPCNDDDDLTISFPFSSDDDSQSASLTTTLSAASSSFLSNGSHHHTGMNTINEGNNSQQDASSVVHGDEGVRATSTTSTFFTEAQATTNVPIPFEATARVPIPFDTSTTVVSFVSFKQSTVSFSNIMGSDADNPHDDSNIDFSSFSSFSNINGIPYTLYYSIINKNRLEDPIHLYQGKKYHHNIIRKDHHNIVIRKDMDRMCS